MTRWSKIRQVLAHLAEGGVGFGLALAVMPTLVVACFGFYLSFKYGYLIELSITLMALSVLGITPILWLRLTAKKSVLETVEEAESDFVKASSDWSERENDLWNNAKAHANTLLEKDDEWASLYVHGLRVVEHVAKQYGKSELEFTLPEGLQLLEEVSFRYRKTLVEHIPAIESIKVSHIKWVYEVQDKYGDDALTAAKFANLGRMAYLAYANPIKLINDEIRNKILASESSSRYSAIQINAKRALLHEVASVSLDLYSGRFTVSAADVKASDVSVNDELNEASPLEPIRVVLVGQTSSGKSSFVNRFLGEFSAEVDELPSSEGITTYSFNDNDLNPLRIIDLQGLDGKDETNKRTLQEMVNADIVVWLLKANQSARQLDHTLRQAFDQFYSEDQNLTHKRPVLFGVVSQVDRLSPQPEWSPPYNTEKPTGEKAKNIAAALEYNQALLKFDEIYPLSIDRKWPVDSSMSSENAEFGFDQIKERLSRHYDAAKNIQRNRQRRDSKSKRSTLVDQTKRFYKSTQTVFRHSKIEKEKK